MGTSELVSRTLSLFADCLAGLIGRRYRQDFGAPRSGAVERGSDRVI